MKAFHIMKAMVLARVVGVDPEMAVVLGERQAVNVDPPPGGSVMREIVMWLEEARCSVCKTTRACAVADASDRKARPVSVCRECVEKLFGGAVETVRRSDAGRETAR